MKGIYNLADTIKQQQKKYEKKSDLILGTMLDDSAIRFDGVTVEFEDYKTLSSVEAENIDIGDDVLIYKPNDEIIVLLGKVE